MKKIIALCFLMIMNISAQTFTVEKVKGKVQVLKGTSEQFVDVIQGQTLTGEDVLVTDNNSFVQLKKDNTKFNLNSNSALGMNYLKQMSINDLLLVLALEEIRSLPKNIKQNNSSSTAIYGSKVSPSKSTNASIDEFGIKRINGAKQLAESGFKESAVASAKETFRKYPSANSDFNGRLFFADLLYDLKLYEEALSDYTKINELELSEEERKIISNRIEKTNLELAEKQ